MVKTLAESGLVVYEPYAGVRLTESGRKLASHVLRRHRLVELFLVEVMGMDWSEVHGEAERLEHVISDRLLERMDEMLGSPSVDPHGDPIPSPQGVVVEPNLNTLLCCPVGPWLEVARVSDQSAEFLRLLERRGLLLGSRLRVTTRDELTETVDLEVDGSEGMSLGFRAAAKIQVVASSTLPS
jgi:DtxR family Mn-dependent transcriptional regulator